jgi:hypothetical protein
VGHAVLQAARKVFKLYFTIVKNSDTVCLVALAVFGFALLLGLAKRVFAGGLVKRRERQDLVMHHVAMELCNGAAAQRGFVNTVDALKNIEPQCSSSKENEPGVTGLVSTGSCRGFGKSMGGIRAARKLRAW